MNYMQKMKLKRFLVNFSNMRLKHLHLYPIVAGRTWAIFSCFLFFIFLLVSKAEAQKGKKQCICDSAIAIGYANVQNIQVHARGAVIPLLSMPHANGMYFEKPHSVVWFTFVVPNDTTLNFDLIPSNHSDDLDFLLFKDQAGNLCNSIQENKRPVPIRANIANNALTTSGRTGLSDSGIHNLEALGKHSAFSKSLKVKKGERYYLAVDDYTRAEGTFNLYLHLRFPPPEKPIVKTLPPPARSIRPLPGPPILKIAVMDSSNKPIKARIKLMIEVGNSRLRIIADTAGTSLYEKTVSPRQRLKIICISEGFLLYQGEVRVSDTASVIYDTARLSSIQEHRSIILQDIEFQPELDIFLPTATEPLSDLLAFMQNNASIHILIKGYVNDPFTQNSDRYDMDLSERRAKAVMMYLINHHIDKNRMEWKGFGNKDMLYPHPQTMEQEIANRRVEIEVEK